MTVIKFYIFASLKQLFFWLHWKGFTIWKHLTVDTNQDSAGILKSWFYRFCTALLAENSSAIRKGQENRFFNSESSKWQTVFYNHPSMLLPMLEIHVRHVLVFVRYFVYQPCDEFWRSHSEHLFCKHFVTFSEWWLIMLMIRFLSPG